MSFRVEEIDPQGRDGKVNPLGGMNYGTAATLLREDGCVEPDDASRAAAAIGAAVREAINEAGMEADENTSIWIRTTLAGALGPIMLCVPMSR
jgi:hypothetical protein